MKEIKVINFNHPDVKFQQTEQFAIVCSGFSGRHIFSTGKALVSEMKKLDCKEFKNLPRVIGRKDDMWVMIVVKEIQVHLIIDEFREDLGLEFRWLNPPTPEETLENKEDISGKKPKL